MAEVVPVPTELDWGAPPRAPLPARAAATALAPLVALGALVAALVGVAAGPLAAAAAALAYAGGLVAWIESQPRRALREAGPDRLDPGSAPRLANLVEGLSRALGCPTPALWVVSGEGPNAIVCGPRSPALGVTRSLLDSYTRTELEAVVAHCLLRLARSSLRREGLAAALGPLARSLCPVVGTPEDVRAVALTRYPPALAAAIRKATPARRGGLFYFVARPPWHEDPEARAAVLDDL